MKKNLKKVQRGIASNEILPIFASPKSTTGLQTKSLINAGVAQLVEHNLAKVRVAGPSPVSRSEEDK